MTRIPERLVLLVDDDDSVRRVAAQSLRKMGFRVVEATDGRAALLILEKSDDVVELILSDVRMPGLSGDQLADIVSQRWPHLPVLLTSGHFSSADDGHQVLPKPYSRAQLARAIAQVLPATQALA